MDRDGCTSLTGGQGSPAVSAHSAAAHGLPSDFVLGPREARFRRPVVVGMVASVAVHIVLGVFAALILLQRPAGPGGLQRQRPAMELAVWTDVELTALEESFSSASEARPFDLTALPDPSFQRFRIEAAPVSLGSLSDRSSLVGSGSGASVGEGMDLGGGSGQGASASFFGAEATGSRFVYIVDISGSMLGEKLDSLKAELARSVSALGPDASFAVFSFHDRVDRLDPGKAWTPATGSSVQRVLRAIDGLVASGGSQPLPAFERAMGLGPKPDAIFFMTDGQVVDEHGKATAPQRIAKLHRGKHPVHCISFVSRKAQRTLRRIAGDSGGSYTHVPGVSP